MEGGISKFTDVDDLPSLHSDIPRGRINVDDLCFLDLRGTLDSSKNSYSTYIRALKGCLIMNHITALF